MGHFINAGKTTITHTAEAKSIVDIYNSWPDDIKGYFIGHFQNAIVGDSEGSDTRFRYYLDQYGTWQLTDESTFTHCECKSNISNQLDIPNSNSNLIYWIYPTVNFEGGNADSPFNPCNWNYISNDTSQPDAIYDSPGDHPGNHGFKIFTVMNTSGGTQNQSMLCVNNNAYGSLSTLHQGSWYNMFAEFPQTLLLPEQIASELDEDYTYCQGNAQYCAQSFIDYGVCPDAQSDVNQGPGCIQFNTLNVNDNLDPTAEAHWLQPGTEIDFYMSGYQDGPLYVTGFDEDALTDVQYNYVGGISYESVGGLCDYCGNNPADAQGLDNHAHCCAYKWGGHRSEYVTYNNSSCRHNWGWPFGYTDGRDCHRRYTPPGYSVCPSGDVYCPEDQMCSFLNPQMGLGSCLGPSIEYVGGENGSGGYTETSCLEPNYWIEDTSQLGPDQEYAYPNGCCYLPEEAGSSPETPQWVCVNVDENMDELKTIGPYVGVNQSANLMVPTVANGAPIQGSYSMSGNNIAVTAGMYDPRDVCRFYAELMDDDYEEADQFAGDYTGIIAVTTGTAMSSDEWIHYQCLGESQSDEVGCKAPSACNYNFNAVIHNHNMCSFEQDCDGNCEKLTDGSPNPNYGWSLDVCGLCSKQVNFENPYQDIISTKPGMWMNECGHCTANEKILFATSQAPELPYINTTEGATVYSGDVGMWYQDMEDGIPLQYTGDAVCDIQGKSCAGVEVQLPDGNWVELTSLPQSYTTGTDENGHYVDWAGHNFNDYITSNSTHQYRSNGCDLNWELISEAAANGDLFIGGGIGGPGGTVSNAQGHGLPFRGIRMICGNRGRLLDGVNHYLLNTKLNGPISNFVRTRAQYDDPTNNGDDVTLHFFTEKHFILPYGSRYTSLVPFLTTDDAADVKYAITRVIDATDYTNFVEVTENGILSNPDFMFEIGKKYNFVLDWNESKPEPFPGLPNGYNNFDSLGNPNYRNTTSNQFVMETYHKMVCCKDTSPQNNMCDTPLETLTFCREAQFSNNAAHPVSAYCGDAGYTDWTVEYVEGQLGDIHGCMDPAAINYNSLANVDANCMYNEPIIVKYQSYNLGWRTSNPDEDGVDYNVSFNRTMSEDIDINDGYITLYDLNYSQHQTVWNTQELVTGISTKNIIENTWEGVTNGDISVEGYDYMEQAPIEAFYIRTDMGVNGLEDMGDYGNFTHEGNTYYNVREYRLHLHLSPGKNVYGSFEEVLLLNLKNPLNNKISKIGWNLTIASKNDNPQIQILGPNLIDDSNVGNWGFWLHGNVYSSDNKVGMVRPNSLLAPGGSINDDFSRVVELKGYEVDGYKVPITHANVYGNAGTSVTLPHNNGNTTNTDAAYIQLYTGFKVPAGRYVISAWVKHLNGELPAGVEGTNFIRLKVRQHSWPWTDIASHGITDAILRSKTQNGQWEFVQFVVDWENTRYTRSTYGDGDYNIANNVLHHKAATPKYCTNSSGAECLYEYMTNSEVSKMKNVAAWDGLRWNLMTENKQDMRVAVESCGSWEEENINIGVYGVQVTQVGDYVEFEQTLDNGYVYPKGIRFVGKENNEYLFLKGHRPFSNYAEETNWDYDDNLDGCGIGLPKLTYKFHTKRDLTKSSELADVMIGEYKYESDFKEISPHSNMLSDYEYEFVEMNNDSAQPTGEFVQYVGHSDYANSYEDCNIWYGAEPLPPEADEDNTPDAPGGGA